MLKTDGSWGGRGVAILHTEAEGRRAWREMRRRPPLARATEASRRGARPLGAPSQVRRNASHPLHPDLRRRPTGERGGRLLPGHVTGVRPGRGDRERRADRSFDGAAGHRQPRHRTTPSSPSSATSSCRGCAASTSSSTTTAARTCSSSTRARRRRRTWSQRTGRTCSRPCARLSGTSIRRRGRRRTRTAWWRCSPRSCAATRPARTSGSPTTTSRRTRQTSSPTCWADAAVTAEGHRTPDTDTSAGGETARDGG